VLRLLYGSGRVQEGGRRKGEREGFFAAVEGGLLSSRMQ